MSTQTTQVEEGSAKRKLSIRTIAVLVLTIVMTIFAVQNWTPVYVWPLGPAKPLILVIGISFVLGSLIGWLLHSILGTHRTLHD